MAKTPRQIFNEIASVIEKEIQDLIGIKAGQSKELQAIYNNIYQGTLSSIRSQVKEFRNQLKSQAFAVYFQGLDPSKQPKTKAAVRISRLRFKEIQTTLAESFDEVISSYLYKLSRSIKMPDVFGRFEQLFVPTSGFAYKRVVEEKFAPKVTYPVGTINRKQIEKAFPQQISFGPPIKPRDRLEAMMQEGSLREVYRSTFANILRREYSSAIYSAMVLQGLRGDIARIETKRILSQLNDIIAEQSEVLLDAYSRGLIGSLKGANLTENITREATFLTNAGTVAKQRISDIAVTISEETLETIDKTLTSLEKAIFEEKVPVKAFAGGMQPKFLEEAPGTKSARLQAIFSKPRFQPLAEKIRELAPGLLNLPEENLKRVDLETIYGGVTRARISYIDQETRAVRTLTLAMDKYGNVLADTSARFRSFIDGVKRDVREFTKWSTAIMLVYLPMQALQGALAAAIEQESLLASVLITLGKSQEYANKTFEDAAKIANETGQSISQVLQGYNLALRAAGNIADYNERIAKANELMKDSITLSILANMDQAAATDTLVAALKQMGLSIDEGTVLLDKWVRVSKIANVDVETLATSFAIVGEAAKQAGISIDELNGIIAIVAAAGITSAKETGNAVRAIISGLTTDRTANELRKYGIAVTDTAGKLRDFKSIVDDIRDAFLSGLISPDQLNRLAYVIGGGNRRQAQVVTALVQFGDVTRIAGESAKASGDAWEAFTKKLETTRISTTRLSNAFQLLVRNVFTSGGILDGIKEMINLFTNLTNVVAGLSNTLGTVIPTLFAIGAGKLFNVGPRFREVLYNIGTGLVPAVLSPFIRSRAAQQPQFALQQGVGGLELTPQRVARLNATLIGEQIGYKLQSYAPQIGAMLAVTFMAGLELAKSGDLNKAGMVIAGGVVGGILAKGNPIGFIIGSSIAEVFAQKVGETEIKIKKAEIPKEVIEAAGGAFNIARVKFFYDLARNINKIFGREMPEFTEEQLSAILATRQGQMLAYGPIRATRRGMSPEEVGRLLQGTRFSIETAGAEVVRKALIDKQMVSDIQKKVSDQLDQMFYSAKPKLSEREFSEAKDRLEGLFSFAQNATVPIKELGISLSQLDVDSLDEFYQSLAEILALSPDDRLERINTVLTEMITLLEKLNSPTASQGIRIFDQFTEEEKVLSVQEAQQRVRELADTFIKEFISARNYIQVSLANLPSFDILSDMTKKDIETAIKFAETYVEEILPMLTDAQRTALEAQAKDMEIFARSSEGIWKRISGLTAMFFREGVDLAKEAGAISGNLGIQKIDIGSDQLDMLLQQTEILWNQLNRAFGYKGEKETVIALLNDNQFRKITTDMTLLRLLLDQISENTEKQLEGIYNLPEGAEFFVPWQAAAMAGANKGGSIDFDSLIKALSVIGDEQTAAIDSQTTALSNKLEELKQAYLQEAAPMREQLFGPKTTVEQDRYGLSRGEKATAERYKGLAEYYQEKTQREKIFGKYGVGAGAGEEILPPPSVQDFFEFFKRMFGITLTPFGTGIAPRIPGQVTPTSTQNLRLSVSSNINLIVDGRVLAQVIRQYLTSETLRFSATQSTISRQVIV